MACGDFHTLCQTENGEVYVWGGHYKAKRGDEPSLRPSIVITHNKKYNTRSVQYDIPCQISAFNNIKIV